MCRRGNDAEKSSLGLDVPKPHTDDCGRPAGQSGGFLSDIPHFREIFLAAFFCVDEESYGRREGGGKPGSSPCQAVNFTRCLLLKYLINFTWPIIFLTKALLDDHNPSLWIYVGFFQDILLLSGLEPYLMSIIVT